MRKNGTLVSTVTQTWFHFADTSLLCFKDLMALHELQP